MTAIKSLMKEAKSLDGSNRNLNETSNAKCQKEVVMSNCEIRNQLEQQYYNKASGCSVRAQIDNLFDYKLGMKKY
jgi:ribosomal protein L30E